MKLRKKLVALISVVLVLSMMLCGCGKGTADTSQTAVSDAGSSSETADTSAASSSSAETSSADDGFPFELTTYNDMVVTFTKVPEKVIASNSNTADQLYAMGVGDKIIGVCYKNSPINPKYQAEYDAAPVLAEKAATLEQLVDAHPDFVYGRSSAFSEKNGTTHDVLTSYGIASLSSIEGYKLGADVEDVYQDFYNLGRIFQLQDRANEIVDEMKDKIAKVETAVKDAEPVKVFVFDMEQEDGPYTCGNNFASKLIRHAGGVNIFEDMDKTWSTVSWESVIEKDPDVIIINDYGDTSLDEKISQLKDNPTLASISAIKNDRIYSVHLCEVFASSMTADTIEKFAADFHPDCFK